MIYSPKMHDFSLKKKTLFEEEHRVLRRVASACNLSSFTNKVCNKFLVVFFNAVSSMTLHSSLIQATILHPCKSLLSLMVIFFFKYNLLTL